MARRAKVESDRLRALLGIMRREEIAPHEHVVTLARELDRIHGTSDFAACQTMGELTAKHVTRMLDIQPEAAVWDDGRGMVPFQEPRSGWP